MATLYVENVPDELYKALRAQAGRASRSISAEVLELLGQHVVTEEELARRKELGKRLAKLRSIPTPPGMKFPSAEEMIREDRER
jgi:plasmid stability protein